MKMHLNLKTRDLDASVAFYRTLLLAEPAAAVAAMIRRETILCH